MKHIIYIIGILTGLFATSAMAQTDGYNPSNPPNPDAPPPMGYRLMIESVPSGATHHEYIMGKYPAGESVWVYPNLKNNFEFVAWMQGKDTISLEESFYYTMPKQDVMLKVIARYRPHNPGDPSAQGTKYKLTLKSKPEGACSFYHSENERWEEGTQMNLGFSTNSHYRFLHWEDDSANVLTQDHYLPFTMPNRNTTLYAVFELDYHPESPANPGKNSWDGATGAVVVDDFHPGSLNSAINEVIGGWENQQNVTQIIASGKVYEDDFRMIWNYPNCSVFDMSRTTGVANIPSWCFEYRGMLTHVLLPSSITNIGDYAFYECSSLTYITCHALVPPQLGYGVFDGVQDGLIVYVPQGALELYQEAEVWKDFVLMPITANVQNLEIRLPEECADGRYKNMSLELLNLKNGRAYKYMVSDRLDYQFNNLIKGTCHRATLENTYGSVLAQIDSIWIGEENISLTFENIRALKDISVSVVDNGKELTGQVDVVWSTADGKYLTKGSSLDGLVEGDQVYCALALPEELAMKYEMPQDTVFTVGAEENNFVVELTPLRKVILKGSVVAAKDKRPAKNAVVTVSQTIHGLYAKTYTAKMDNKGHFSIEVLAQPSTIVISSPDYISQAIEITADMMEGNEVSVEEIALEKMDGAAINTKFTFVKRTLLDEKPDMAEYYEDYHNVSFSIFNKTQQKQVTEFTYLYPYILLQEPLAKNEELEITVTSMKNVFAPATIQVRAHKENTVNAHFHIKELGAIQATYVKTDNVAVQAMLYDASGNFVQKFSYKDRTMLATLLPDGKYVLVSMGENQLYSSMPTLKSFEEVGLTEGVDYVKNEVSVESGVTSAVKNHLVPFFDESKFYYTDFGTTFTVNKTSVVVGNYLTFQARLEFKQDYADRIKDVELLFDVPASCSFVDNSLLVGTKTSAYQKEGGSIIVALDDAEVANARVRFCLVPTEAGNIAPHAYVRFRLGEKVVTQPIGSAAFEAKGLSITVPAVVARETFVVNGSSTPKSSVHIYDGDQLIGQTTSLANGLWSANCMLNTPHNLSAHPIHAKVVSPEGLTFITETKTCIYNTNAVEVKNVSMTLYNGWMQSNVNLNWNFETSTTDNNSYSFYSGTDFTFIFDLTNNDSTIVDGVDLYVHTDGGSVKKLAAVYNKKLGRWVATGYFDYGYLPVNISCELLTSAPVSIENIVLKNQEGEELAFFAASVQSALESKILSEVLVDEVDRCEFTLEDSIAGEKINIAVKQLDFEKTKALMSTMQFEFFKQKDGTAYICYRIEEIAGGYAATVLSLAESLAFEIAMTGADSVSAATGMDIKALKQYWLSGEVFNDCVLNLTEGGRYLRTPNFSMWFDIHEMYLQDDAKYRNIVKKLIQSKCSDGSYKMSQSQREEFELEQKALESASSAYFRLFSIYLNEYSLKLRNTLVCDAIVSVVNKAVQEKAAGSKLFANEINALYFERIASLSTASECKASWMAYAMGMLYNTVSGADKLFDPSTFKSDAIEDGMNEFVTSQYADLRVKYIALINKIKATPKRCGNIDEYIETSPIPPFVPVRPIIDPSGYVYEAVHSNRLEGVMATCYFKEFVKDEYGDVHEVVGVWDAEEYAQKNPLFTDEFGMYAWEVPQGLWQVKYQKDGYETAYSEWLPVPPPPMDVNVGLVQNVQPEVVRAKAYQDGVELLFSKYMKPESFTKSNLYLKAVVGGQEELLRNLTIEFPDEEAVSDGDTITFAKKVLLKTERDLTLADEVYVVVNGSVESYAGIAMGNDYVQRLDVEKKINDVVVDSVLYVGYEDAITVTVGVLPADASKGKIIMVRSLSEDIVTVSAQEAVLDENGQATFTFNGELMGATAIEFYVEDADLRETSMINVVDASWLSSVKDVDASFVNGAALYRGQTVSLSCETEGARIYYTLDGTSPKDAGRQTYSAPIVINGNTTLKAIAVGLDGSESNIREYVYTIRSTQAQLPLQQGWNWLSHSDADGMSAKEFEYSQVQRVLTKTNELFNDVELGFVGNLSHIAAHESFKVKISEGFNLQVDGELYNPNAYVVRLQEGWNWLGYPIEQTMSLAEALAYLDAEEEDVITTQTGGFAQFVDGQWKGTLETMKQGEGYLYKSKATKNFVYNDTFVSKAKSQYGHKMDMTKSPWTVNVHEYPNMMCVIADLYAGNEQAAEDEYCIAAFSGDVCRGVAKYVDGRIYLSVYGTAQEEIYFVALNKETNEVYAVSEKIRFTPDVVGSHSAPMTLHINGATDIEGLDAAPEAKDIYNLQGQKLQNVKSNGLYIVDGKKVFINSKK